MFDRNRQGSFWGHLLHQIIINDNDSNHTNNSNNNNLHYLCVTFKNTLNFYSYQNWFKTEFQESKYITEDSERKC